MVACPDLKRSKQAGQAEYEGEEGDSYSMILLCNLISSTVPWRGTTRFRRAVIAVPRAASPVPEGNRKVISLES